MTNESMTQQQRIIEYIALADVKNTRKYDKHTYTRLNRIRISQKKLSKTLNGI